MAGLDAGHAYNEFPLMGGRLVPAEYWALPGMRNFFENTAAVQFNHRLLATTTLASVASVWAACRGTPLPGGSKVLLHSLMAVTAAQVGLSRHASPSCAPSCAQSGTACCASKCTCFSEDNGHHLNCGSARPGDAHSQLQTVQIFVGQHLQGEQQPSSNM